MVKIIAAIVISLTLLLGGEALRIPEASPRDWHGETLTLGSPQKIQIKVETADDEAERTRGLSGRAELGPEAGLLFIFDQSTRPSFWMKEMNFPIDIIWINEDWQIAGITPNLWPQTYPQTFSPSQPIKYVLEVNAGFATKHNLKVGDELTLETN